MSPTDEKWLSVRMRASRDGRHVSGGERLTPQSHALAAVEALLRRAQERTDVPDGIVLTVRFVARDAIRVLPALAVRTVAVEDADEGKEKAAALLRNLGISAEVVRKAVALLESGASPDGTNMRGAMLMDAQTGQRLESDPYRGVRVSVVDMTPTAKAAFTRAFAERFPASRLRDALILATKAASVKGIVAELCWSDDPDYTAGVVASRSEGYVRFTHLKPQGVPFGGRVYFVETSEFDLKRDAAYLESEPVLVGIPTMSLLEEA